VTDLETLVLAAQHDDMEAFGELVGRFQNMAIACANGSLRDVHQAEDVAQEAFIQAFRDLKQLRVPAAFPSWLRRIVLKYCDRTTRRKRLPTTSLTDADEARSPEPTPEESLRQKELKQRVMAAVQALPERQRSTTTLHYVNGMSQKAVAEFMQLPLTTVKKRLHAARKAMRARMIYGDDED